MGATSLIRVAVFGGFIFNDDPIIKAIGLAPAFGVFVDAFIVRMTLVPAAMALVDRPTRLAHARVARPPDPGRRHRRRTAPGPSDCATKCQSAQEPDGRKDCHPALTQRVRVRPRPRGCRRAHPVPRCVRERTQ
ncbi:MMPL family transporter [Streptomyces sp. NPDC057636]|uniref:MMPL family transporter n=1 Tax=Streptomyces sp. NPDC057636 TaxID=3346189 RepID=UPI0036C6D0DF